MSNEEIKGKIINIGNATFDELVSKKNVLLIDVRDRNDYNKGHIKGAVNIPFDYFEKNVNNIPHNREIVLYCDMGNTSITCSRILARKGYVVYNLVNGLTKYKGMYYKI